MRHQGLILRQLGDLDSAQVQFVEGERLCRELGDNYGLQAAICNQGVILSDRGDLKGAKKLFEEQEHICRELGNMLGLIISLGNQGEVYQSLGDLENALRLYKEQECICREHGNPNGLRWSLSNQANILEISGEFTEAEKLRIELNKIGGASPWPSQGSFKERCRKARSTPGSTGSASRSARSGGRRSAKPSHNANVFMFIISKNFDRFEGLQG